MGLYLSSTSQKLQEKNDYLITKFSKQNIMNQPVWHRDCCYIQILQLNSLSINVCHYFHGNQINISPTLDQTQVLILVKVFVSHCNNISSQDAWIQLAHCKNVGVVAKSTFHCPQGGCYKICLKAKAGLETSTPLQMLSIPQSIRLMLRLLRQSHRMMLLRDLTLKHAPAELGQLNVFET